MTRSLCILKLIIFVSSFLIVFISRVPSLIIIRVSYKLLLHLMISYAFVRLYIRIFSLPRHLQAIVWSLSHSLPIINSEKQNVYQQNNPSPSHTVPPSNIRQLPSHTIPPSNNLQSPSHTIPPSTFLILIHSTIKKPSLNHVTTGTYCNSFI